MSLIRAIQAGSLNTVQFCVETEKVDINNANEEDGRTPLHWYAYESAQGVIGDRNATTPISQPPPPPGEGSCPYDVVGYPPGEVII